MKKVRRIFVLLAVFVLCLSFCGCDTLEELRAARAIFTESDSIKLQDGTEYILLPDCQELTPVFTEYETVYLVEEELPLLLTVFSDNYATKSDDGLFLQTFSEAGAQFYCRSDCYDSILERIQGGFVAASYCYYCFDYETGEQSIATLLPTQAEAIDRVLATQEPETLPTGASLNYESYVDLYLCAEDRLFLKDTVDIAFADGAYYVISNGNVNTFYSVPAELSATFETIMDAAMTLW